MQQLSTYDKRVMRRNNHLGVTSKH